MRLSRPCLTGPALLAACALWAFFMLQFSNSSSSSQQHPAAAIKGVTSIAYFLQITDDNIGNVPRLLSALHHPDNIYALHADMRCAKEKVDKINNLIAGNDKKYDNVRLMPQTHVTYKGVTMVLSTVEGIVFLLQWSIKWTYFINLSGSDYPLLPQDGIIELLHNATCPSNNTSSMEENIPSFINFAEPISRWRELVIDPGLSEVQADLLYAVHSRATSGLRFMVRDSGCGDDVAIENPTIPSFRVEKGSAWVILSREFCKYVATSNQGRRMLMFFANSPSSPEHFFQTMSTYASRHSTSYRVIKDGMRAIVWHLDGKPNSNGQHPYELDNVTTFWPTLSASGALFARKFPERSPLLDKIDGLHKTEVAQFLQRARQRLKRPCN